VAPAIVRATSLRQVTLPTVKLMVPVTTTTVTFIEPAAIHNYKLGDWVLIVSLDMQTSLPSGLIIGEQLRIVRIDDNGNAELDRWGQK
jgi:hypothetical protein